MKSAKFDAYINTKFAALTFSKKERVTHVAESNPPILYTEKISGGDCNAPLTFGIVADYKVGNDYITFNYNDIVGLSVDSNKEFPIDFTLGYKFIL